jgi:hypothetical protein
LWGWTQFGKKSGWEWVQLLIVPLALVGIGFAFDIRQQGIEDRRAERARAYGLARAGRGAASLPRSDEHPHA